MIRDERAKWCVEQAEDIESGLGPRPDEDGLIPIQYAMADWFRDAAFQVAGVGREAGHA